MINRIDFNAWRTEEHDGLPSDRTFESGKLGSLAAQEVAGFGIHLTSNLTAKADSMRYDLSYIRKNRCLFLYLPTMSLNRIGDRNTWIIP